MKPLTERFRCRAYYYGFLNPESRTCYRKLGHKGKHRTKEGFEWV